MGKRTARGPGWAWEKLGFTPQPGWGGAGLAWATPPGLSTESVSVRASLIEAHRKHAAMGLGEKEPGAPPPWGRHRAACQGPGVGSSCLKTSGVWWCAVSGCPVRRQELG